MTRTRKLYEFVTGINFKSIVPKVLNIAIFFVCTYLFLNVMNTYAATYEEVTSKKIGIQVSFQDTYLAKSTRGEDDAGNVYTLESNTNLARAFDGLEMMDPTLIANNDEIEASKLNSSFVKSGLMGFVDEATVALYRNQPSPNVPEHMAKQWVPGYDQSVRSTVAAEDGYELLSSIGIDELWEKTRLIAYVLFVIILMAAGFMIMFRQKIGGQVMITVFNTLPGVIVGLILVTFSFAIVGVVLNLGMVLVNVIGNLLDPSGQSLISVNGPFSLLNPKNIAGFISEPSEGRGLALGGSSILSVIVGALALILDIAAIGAATLLAAPIAFVLLILFVAFVILTASIKVYITVLTAYIGIILDTVLAPFYLVAAALPGQSAVGSDWFKRILRNTLTFPLVFFFVNLGAYILKSDISFVFPGGLVGDYTGPVDGALNSGVAWLMKALLTLVLFYVAAESPKFLLDILPTNGGKGAGAVIEGAKASMSKIPLVGGFFK